ncbi:MAG: heme-binding protein [Ghiorsea sp.]
MFRFSLVTVCLLFVNLMGGYQAMAVEEPKFEVLEQEGDFQVRQYAPMIVAEVLVDGSLDDASSQGFRLIAAYIFGENTSVKGGSEKIAMTVPVTMEPSSEKIAMTAPVTMAEEGNQYRMFFVMPSEYSVDNLPKPNNPIVSLREVPAQKAAVLQFSWLAGEDKVAEKTALLQQWMQNKDFHTTSAAQLARYNPPWTLPFLRRNEIIINIE